MSEPFDFPLPYGVTVEGDGANRTAIPVGDHPKIMSGKYIKLPAGPCRVAVSWSGSESVRASLLGVGYPVTLPAGGGFVSGTAAIGAKDGDKIMLENTVDRPLAKGARGTIEVYPVNLE